MDWQDVPCKLARTTREKGYAGSNGKGQHVLAWEKANGRPVRGGMHIDHKCRVRNCVEPLHLEEVSPRENVLRGEGLAARNARKTECPTCGGPYSTAPSGRRYCNHCKTVRQRNRRASA